MLTTGIVGIAGAVTGVLIERSLRLIGRVRCLPSWRDVVYFSLDDYGTDWGQEPERLEDVAAAEYRFGIDLFNGRETPTGLREPRLVLVRSDGVPVETRAEMIKGNQSVINLPPRQYVPGRMVGRFDKDGAVALFSGGWKRIEFVAERSERPFLGILGSKTYRKTITEPSDWR